MALNHALLWILAAGGCVLGLHALWRGLRGARLATVLAAAARGLLVLGGICLGVLAIVFAGAQGPAVAPAERPVQLRPPPARTPLGDPPPLLLWLVAGGVLLASAGVAAWMLRPSPPRRRAVDDVALEAQRAREALLAGEDPRTVILACYARMSRALAEERGIERPESMTAREFGALLGTLGIPHAPVQELTRLFEAVRYGGLEPGAGEEARAVACLGAIVQHCRAAGERA